MGLKFTRSPSPPNAPKWVTFNIAAEDADEAEARLAADAPSSELLEKVWGSLPAGSLLLEEKKLAFKFAKMVARAKP